VPHVESERFIDNFFTQYLEIFPLEAAPFQSHGRADYFYSEIALAFRGGEKDQHRQLFDNVVEAMLDFGCNEQHAAG